MTDGAYIDNVMRRITFQRSVCMCHVVIIGSGITGVTSAYELAQLGYQVTVIDKHLFPAMETSFANGGQLSACNAEVESEVYGSQGH